MVVVGCPKTPNMPAVESKLNVEIEVLPLFVTYRYSVVPPVAAIVVVPKRTAKPKGVVPVETEAGVRGDSVPVPVLILNCEIWFDVLSVT